MKKIILSLFILFAGELVAAPGLQEALKNPSGVTVLKFTGGKDEAALFMKNAFRFTALTAVELAGISDSVVAEQDISAVAACPSVVKISFHNCGFSHLSPAVKMLVSVKEVEIANCEKLETDGAFYTLFGMPSLKNISYSTGHFVRVPGSFKLLRGLQRISIINTDLSLADGYALNTSGAKSLFVTEQLQLGFGTAMLLLEYSCYDKKSAKEHISIMRDMLQGVAGMNNGMQLPVRNVAFTRNHPLVKPPITGLDVRKNCYTTDALTGGAIDYPSGTKIYIPDHAFVDADGNPVEGNVTIDYREFRDQVDILVSGIPMVYDSAGQKGNFESAGMFEINASVDGKEVFLAPGKKVDLEFAVVDTASDYNFYRLDEQNGWEYEQALGKIDNPEQQREGEDLFPAYAFHRRTLTALARLPKLIDTTSIDARYADFSYFYTTKNKNYAATAAKRIFAVSYWSLKKEVSKKAYCCFKIHRRYNNGNNPEMSAFSNVTWKTTDNVRTKEMRRLFRRKNGVNDIRVYYDGGEFQLEFKTFEGYKTISAVPVHIVNKKEVEFAPAMMKARYKLYSRILERRKRSVEKEIKRNKNYVAREKRRLSADSLRAWKRLRMIMPQRQKEMSYAEWVAFAGKQEFNSFYSGSAALSSAAYQYQREAYQRLSTFKFGIFNCDHTLPLPEPVQVFAICNVDGQQDKSASGTSTIYLVDQRKNMTIAYAAPEQSSPVPIAFGRTHSYALVAVSWDGLVSVADVNAFQTRRKLDEKTCAFETTSVSDQPLSVQELRQLILKSR